LVDKLIVLTKNVDTILHLMNELGTCYYCDLGKGEYRVVYFSNSRECFFEGSLTQDQLKQIQEDSHKVSKITVNEEAGEIRIEEL
jgi:hypothetical protein